MHSNGTLPLDAPLAARCGYSLRTINFTGRGYLRWLTLATVCVYLVGTQKGIGWKSTLRSGRNFYRKKLELTKKFSATSSRFADHETASLT